MDYDILSRPNARGFLEVAMNYQLANLSTDLRRISYWIYYGRTDLAKEFISNAKNRYKIKSSVGPFMDVWKEVEKIKLGKEGSVRAADRATTLASVLLQESLKR